MRALVECSDRSIAYSLFLCLLFILGSCGGSSSSSSPPPAAAGEETSESPSTLLAQNNIAIGSRFDNFKNETVSIDPSALPLGGSHLFLKLYLSDGDSLFLGEIDRYGLFSLPISIAYDETIIYYELFTELLSDTTITGSIEI